MAQWIVASSWLDSTESALLSHKGLLRHEKGLGSWCHEDLMGMCTISICRMSRQNQVAGRWLHYLKVIAFPRRNGSARHSCAVARRLWCTVISEVHPSLHAFSRTRLRGVGQSCKAWG